jgi:hypothetical protein
MSAVYTHAFTRDSGTQIVAIGDEFFKRISVPMPEKKNEEYEKQILAPWGIDNKFPILAQQYIEKSSILAGALRDIIAFTYGMGVFTYKTEEVATDGSELVRIIHDKQIEAWMEQSLINRYCLQTISDYYRLGNAVPWFIMNQGKVHQLRVIKAARARREKVDPTTGYSEYVYESGQWDTLLPKSVKREIKKEESRIIKKLRVLDPYDYFWQLGKSGYKNLNEFAYWIDTYTSDREYYHDSPWHTAIRNGWLDIDIGVPEMKKALFKNAITLRYIISIDVQYWYSIYGQTKWAAMTTKEKDDIMNAKFDEIEKYLKGAANAYKSITSEHYLDARGVVQDKIKITVVDDKMKDGSFLPDGQQAASIILAAIGIDPSITGMSIPGAQSNSRSGSDKREGLFILNNKLKIVRDAILEPLYMVKKINGWDADIKFGFRNIELTTLDKNPTGQKTVGS